MLANAVVVASSKIEDSASEILAYIMFAMFPRLSKLLADAVGVGAVRVSPVTVVVIVVVASSSTSTQAV
jgi:hypothetical protein